MMKKRIFAGVVALLMVCGMLSGCAAREAERYDVLASTAPVRAMTAAYAAFANEGVWREARTYTIVKDSNGQVILDNTQESHVAMKDMTAWYITDMLETTVQTGTGTAAQLENMAVAGKTGTTSRDFDRWFAGYTPYYTGVVWCGYNDPEEIVLTELIYS